MNIIKIILKRIAKLIHFRLYSEWTEEEKLAWDRQYSSCKYTNSNETSINPATGLPMSGGIDSGGNSFGSSSSSDYHRRTNDDCYRSHLSTSYSSSYDSFINRN